MLKCPAETQCLHHFSIQTPGCYKDSSKTNEQCRKLINVYGPVSAKLVDTFHGCENIGYSVLDLKSHYRGLKYLHETLKILPQKSEPIVIEQIAEHLGSIGAIHYTQSELKPG